MLPRDNNQQFSLVMLGTKTSIEGKTADKSITRLAGYERGETLNAIFREAEGVEFTDKHISSGPATKGIEFDQKAAEGLLMALKAISAGKIDIKIAAHSRGAVESIVIANRIQEILDTVKKDQEISIDKLKELVTKIAKQKTDNSNNDVGCINITKDNKLNFKTSQNKTPDIKIASETSHEIDIANLLTALKKPEEIKLNLFLIDPVPGQKNLVSSWVKDEFFAIPEIVKNIEIVYKADERTAFFEPALPFKVHPDCNYKITIVPGHHGTASGNYEHQGSEAKDIIAADEDEIKGKRGKKTRHVQKLMIQKLVTFFNLKPLVAYSPTKGKRDKIPLIEKTINSCRQRTESERKAYILKRYNKIIQEILEFNKFKKTGYAGLSLISSEKRSILTGLKASQYIDDVKELHAPPGGYINHEHILLALDELSAIGLDSNKPGAPFIKETFGFLADCFNNANKDHKDRKGLTHKNQEVIDYFCKHENQVYGSSLYFNLILEPFISGTISALLDESNELHGEIAKECKDILLVTEKLIDSIHSYANQHKSKFQNNATTLSIELKKIRDKILSSVKERVENKITDIENELDNLAKSEMALPANESIHSKLKHIKSTSTLLSQLQEIKNSGLVQEIDFDHFTKQLKLTLKSANFALVSFLEKTQSLQRAAHSSLKLSLFNAISFPYLKDHVKLNDDLEVISHEMNADVDIDYLAIKARCKLIKANIANIRTSYTDAKAVKQKEIIALIGGRPKKISLSEPHSIINDFITAYTAANEDFFNTVNSFNSQLTQNLSDKVHELNHKELEIEILERLCDSRSNEIENNKKLLENANKLDALSCKAQLKRLDHNISKANDLNLSLLQIVQAECLSIMDTNPDEAVQLKVSHTLNTVNTFVEAKENEKNYDALFNLSIQHANSNQTSFRVIGACMIALGCLSLLGCIALGVLTFGVGLIPLAPLVATLLVSALGFIGVSTTIVGAFSLFQSKQTPLYDALKDAADQKPSVFAF